MVEQEAFASQIIDSSPGVLVKTETGKKGKKVLKKLVAAGTLLLALQTVHVETIFQAGIESLQSEINGLETKISKGVRLHPPGLEVEDFDVRKNVLDPGQATTIIVNRDFFESHKYLRYVHRTNSIEDINKAFKKGANLFDIDINAISEDDIRAEHGFNEEIKVGDKKINVVFDPNELELAFRPPPTFEDLTSHLASLSTPDNRLCLQLQLKHGRPDKKTLENIIDILNQYDVPSYFLWDEHGYRFTLREISDEKNRILVKQKN